MSYEASAASLIEAIRDVPGWSPEDELMALYVLSLTTSPLGGDIIEIGSWCGRSTAVLAASARQSGAGALHAVDLFPRKSDWHLNEDGTHSLSVKLENGFVAAYHEQTVWDEPFQNFIAPLYRDDEDGVRKRFDATLAGLDLSKYVNPFRGTSSMFAEAGKISPRGARFAFLDGDHSYRGVCEDIDAVERFLVPGGWVAFDDAFSSYDGVDQAIRDRIINSERYELQSQLCRKLFVARRV